MGQVTVLIQHQTLDLSIFWCELKPNAKFQNPRTTPYGRKVTRGEEREKTCLKLSNM
jgi:hypothetical protein